MTAPALLFRRAMPALIGALLATIAFASAAQEATIRKVLPSRYPKLAITAVNRTPVPGLYEVVAGSEIFYSDASGEYLVAGPLFATHDQHNVTQDHIDAINAAAWSQLPFASAIVTKVGTGARKMMVFADPNCGYCRKLENETLPKMKDVTVYTLLIPIISDDSKPKSRNIMCAADPAAAWNAWMTKGEVPPAAPAKCDPKVIDLAMAFADAKKIRQTPMIYFPDGKLVAGVKPADELDALLASSQR